MSERDEKPKKTSDDVLHEFLAELKPRLSARTYDRYAGVILWLERYQESYWPGHDGEYDAVTKAGGTYGSTYGPEDIAKAFGMFLDYFIPCKCMSPQGWIDAAPTVIRKLAKWLVQKGYDPNAEDALE